MNSKLEKFKQSLIEKIKASNEDEDLGALIARANQIWNRPRFVAEPMSARDSAVCAVTQDKQSFVCKLDAPVFADLSDFFCLTTGLHIVAAPSGHGKTFWALEWAKQNARDGRSSVIVSLEMTAKDLGARFASSVLELPLDQIVTQRLSQVQCEVATEVLKSTDTVWLDKIYIDHIGDYDWVKILPRLTELILKKKPSVLIVDYAQMIYNSTEKDFRFSKVLSEVARDLKLFADNSGIAVLLLSQLNREALKEAKSSKWGEFGFVPLSCDHVKESGGIVEAADSVQLVCIPQKFSSCPYELRGRFQVSVDKSRRLGKTGVVMLTIDPETMTFGQKVSERE